MKKMSILIGIFTVFLLNCFVLSAYSKKQNVYNLNGTSWELIQVSRKGKNIVIPKGTKITINFSENEINGFSGINNYSGDYMIKNNSTLSADVATTLMAGSENLMNIEQNFLDILQSFPKISYSANTMTLSNNKKEVEKLELLDEKANDAYFICKKLVKSILPEMNLVIGEYTFDENKLIFYFTAETRLDFRELVKEVNRTFRKRVEFYQIKQNDEGRILSAFGRYGKEIYW